MPAQILDGRALGAIIKDELKEKARKRAALLGWMPGLAIVRVGEDPASGVYTKQLLRAAGEIGIEARLLSLDSDTTTDDTLQEELARLNDDERVQGILLQMPLPAHLSQESAANAILSTK